MKGDFSRWSFQPQKHYHGVLKQQGRVDLDSDWNEQGAIAMHRIEAEATDVIGASGAPEGDAGFVIQPAGSGASLSISAGRAYVDGILCENEQQNLLLTSQPDLPGFTLPTTAATYIAYLEVWERHITFLDDSEILEVALGGPDTCTRARTVWQVKLVQAGATGANITCSTDVTAYDALIAASTGTLMAQAQPTASTDPCMVPATAGYQSLDNQLYRVEIHNAGTGAAAAGSVTFKWSRENGSIVSAWTAFPSGQSAAPNTLWAGNPGKDSVLGFAAGQWIELSDDTHELNFQPGTLVQLTNVQGNVLTVDPTTVIPTGASLALTSYGPNPKIRRWDSTGATSVTTGSFLPLENGVQVQFAAGTYGTGDYWMIPARTLTGSIDWPVVSGSPVALPPKGIQRHYCRLAVVQFDGKAWTVVAPCLPLFPPLTNLAQPGIHVTDVQTLSPAGELGNDTLVLVANLAGGINVLLDTAVDPASAKPATCFVTVDLPYPLDLLVANRAAVDANTTLKTNVVAAAEFIQTLWGYQPLVLPGTVSAKTTTSGNSTTNQIIWQPANPAIASFLTGILNLMPALQSSTQLEAHLTLKGNSIWSQNNPKLYLDGEAFGVESGSNIGLRLPSGNGIQGGDFEMWFWLVVPVSVTQVNFVPNPVTVTPSAPQTATGTLTLAGTQLTAGSTVALTSQSLDASGAVMPSSIGTVPASVTLGTNPAPTFSVTGITLPAGVATATLQVTASYAGSTAQGSLTVNAQVSVSKLGFNATSVIGAASATLTVTLNVPAPAGGAVVALSSNAVAAAGAVAPATVPTSATVLAGQTSVAVTVTTIQRATTAGNFVLQVTATLNGTATASLTITPPPSATIG